MQRRKQKSDDVKQNLFTPQVLLSTDPEVGICRQYHMEWILRIRVSQGLGNMGYGGRRYYGMTEQMIETVKKYNNFLIPVELHVLSLLHGYRTSRTVFSYLNRSQYPFLSAELG